MEIPKGEDTQQTDDCEVRSGETDSKDFLCGGISKAEALTYSVLQFCDPLTLSAWHTQSSFFFPSGWGIWLGQC